MLFRYLFLISFFIASIAVSRLQAQACSDTLVMYYSPEFVDPNESFCIDFKVKNFECVDAFQFGMEWHIPSVNYLSVRGFSLVDFTPISFNMNMIKSRLTCAWLSSTGEPRTLDDGTILFQLCGTNMDRQNVQLIQFDLNTTALTSEASYCASTGCIVLEEVPACDDYFQYRAVTMRSLNGFDCREASLENEAVYLMRNSSGLETEIDAMDDSALAVCLDEGWTIRPVHGTGYQAVPSFRLLEETKLANLINGNVIRDTFCLIPSSTMRNDPGTPTKGNPFKSGGTIERRVSESSDDLVDLELSIFPNPVEGDFTVTANDEIRELTCFDLYGKVVFRAESLSGSDQYRISGDHFTSGVYLVWIRTKAGWASTRVVIR